MNTENIDKTRALAGQNSETKEQRKARQREAAKRVSKLSEAQRAELARSVMVTTIEGRTLSVHNLCLIAYQIPNATIVGGFKQWLRAGRCVMKGQHGAVIWVPIGRKAKGSDELEEKTGFVLGSVFDVSQTSELEVQPPREAPAIETPLGQRVNVMELAESEVC